MINKSFFIAFYMFIRTAIFSHISSQINLQKINDKFSYHSIDMYSEKDLEKITEIFISNVPGLRKLFLFGSNARGTASEESDIDIAVIVDTQLTMAHTIVSEGKVLWTKKKD